jgi:hypothetical protein
MLNKRSFDHNVYYNQKYTSGKEMNHSGSIGKFNFEVKARRKSRNQTSRGMSSKGIAFV